VTKDGVLVCLHDDSLERTTNVSEVFPDRFTMVGTTRRWMLADFTLAEVKQLDAGSWFHPKFAGERVLTFDEAVEIVRERAGALPRAEIAGALPRISGCYGRVKGWLSRCSTQARSIVRRDWEWLSVGVSDFARAVR
jgi:glycerophosphoryl diester phosphodiesterase